MQSNNTYNDEVAEGLREMTVSQLDIFTKRMNIPMTSTLSKKEMITYLEYLLDKATYDMTSIRRFETPDEYQPFVFSVDLNSVSVFGNGKPKKVIHYKGEDEDKEEFKQVLIAEAEEAEAEEAAEAAAAAAALEAQKKAEEEALRKAEEEQKKAEQDALLESIPEDPGIDVAEGETYEFVDAVYEDPSQKPAEEPQQEEAESTEEVVEEVQEEPGVVYEETEAAAQEIENTYDELTEGAPEGTSAEYLEEQNADEPIILDEDLSDVESASDEEIAALMYENGMRDAEVETEEAPKDLDFNAYDVKKNELYGSETIMKYANNTSVKTIIISIFLGLSVVAAIIVLAVILKG
jgi:hypothetical protein